MTKPDPNAPALAVKVQEVFGWPAAPTIADGRIHVVLHLLSPAGRPVAVTSDLPSFGVPAIRRYERKCADATRAIRSPTTRPQPHPGAVAEAELSALTLGASSPGRDRSSSASGGVEQLCAPKGKPATQTVEVLADQAVLREVVGVEQLRLCERVGEPASIEGDV